MTSADTAVLAGAERAAPGPSSGAVPQRQRRPGWRREAGWIAATLTLTLLALVLVMQLWRATPGVPFTSEGDAGFTEMTVQNVIDTGWYERAPRLGAPFGADLYDFPQGGDNLQFLVIRGLTLFSSNAATVTNAYFVLTFLLVALSALVVLRWLGVSRAVSAVVAILYAFLPYHFLRGEAHLFLSGYFAVPVGVALAVTVIRGESLFARRPGTRPPAAFATGRTLLTLALAALIGSAGSYYAVFTIVLLGAAAGLQSARGRSLRPALPAAAVAVVIVGALGLNLLPNVMYRSAHGLNTRVAQRTPEESERYGLKVASLLLPSTDHRVAPLASLSARYRRGSDVPSEDGQSLGIIGALGLLWLLSAALISIAGGRGLPGTSGTHRTLAYLAVVSLLTGTIGGFSVLVAYFLTPQFRSWNRFSVVVGFLALAAVGLLLDGWWARRNKHLSRPTGSALLALVLVVGLLDQTSAAAVPDYRETAAQHTSDLAFVADIETRLPQGAMVYQLPFISFPETAPVAGTGPYDQARGYLLSKKLRWSFGGMRGRDGGWQQALVGQPLEIVLTRLATVGFSGLWIDRDGYTDHGRSLEDQASRLLGAPPLVSADGRLSFFTLVDYRAALQRSHPGADFATLSAQTLAPVQVGAAAGIERRRLDGGTVWMEGGRSGALATRNPGPATRAMTFDTRIESVGQGTLSIIWPDGSAESVGFAAGETPVHLNFAAPPGGGTIRFEAAGPAIAVGPAESVFRFRLVDPAIYDTPPAAFTPAR
jgi:phosphoglycerol transferase